MKTMTDDLREKILLQPHNLSRILEPTCTLRVPGLPAITAKISITTNGSTIRFDVPDTDITSDTQWYNFIDGEPGQLIREENYGEALGKDSDGNDVYLNKCLVQGRCWSQQPVKSISAKGVTAHELQISPASKSKPLLVFESYVLSGFDLPHWPDVTDTDDGDGGFSLGMDRITISTSGGDWIFRKIDSGYVRVLYPSGSDTAFANFQYLADILPLLGFINGRRIYLAKKELYDQAGDFINETYLRNLAPETHPAQSFPIPLQPDHESQLIYQLPHLFKDLSSSYLDWKKKIFLDEAIFHLHSALTSALESKFAVLSICFETLASSYSRHKSGNQTEASKYFDNDEFNREMKPIMDLFTKAFKVRLDPGEYESMKGKLLGINNRAMSNRFKMILSDVGLKLTKQEDKILLKRNPAIHDGVLVRERDKINWQEIIGYEGVMLTIINRMILRLLKYTEKVIDYGVVGHPERDA